jgi:hypothetical protein
MNGGAGRFELEVSGLGLEELIVSICRRTLGLLTIKGPVVILPVLGSPPVK